MECNMFFFHAHTVDGSEIPNNHLGCIKPCKPWDIYPLIGSLSYSLQVFFYVQVLQDVFLFSRMKRVVLFIDGRCRKRLQDLQLQKPLCEAWINSSRAGETRLLWGNR